LEPATFPERFNPHMDKNYATALSKVASFKKMMRAGVVAAAQFPDQLQDEHGTITKPARWN